MKLRAALFLSACTLASPVLAQDTVPSSGATEASDEAILITGSRIKRDPNDSALPLQIITTEEISRNGISSPEQLIAFLTSNGSGADNLASNSDVLDNDRRGNNGTSLANLRGQGAAGTLVLLNSRRVAAHGTTGQAVDVNQIPFMAIERVEVLKDGASAIYGTDAVGGVINFITKTDYTGFGASAFVDVTQRGDSPIYRLSGIAGYGDLNEQGFNIMAAVGYSWVNPLHAKQRDFSNGFQRDRGLGIDTRGTPFATIVNLAGTAFPNSASFPLIPGTTTRATGGINLLRIPGGPGCDAIEDMDIYDTDVWGNPANGLACSYDTSANVYLQQEIDTLTYLGRGVARFGDHEVTFELTGSKADSTKRYSEIQITPTTARFYEYDLEPGVNDAAYANIYNTLISAFPTLAATIPYGEGFSYRLRCLECGERTIYTTTKTFRALVSADGPIAPGWDYRVGASYAESQSDSTLGGGFYYQTDLLGVLNSGYFNPFLYPGQTQSPQALSMLAAASAEGTRLYGGKYTVTQGDASVSGSLFRLPGGMVRIAAGVDYRREKYNFLGDNRVNPTTIFAAPFDSPANNLDGVARDIKAAYAEILLPVFAGFELNLAGRIDDYTGFGTTTNPKISAKWRPIEALMFRASYNTAFRVPSFNQVFNAQVRNTYTGADYADPLNCPGGVVDVGAGCPSVSRLIDLQTGGNPNLGPETAEGFSAGVVIQPVANLTASVDWWKIDREGTITVPPLQYMFQNYSAFEDRFIRDGSGTLIAVDQTWSNLGATRTEGIDVNVRGYIDAGNGRISAGIDGTYLLTKEQMVGGSTVVIDQVGVYSLANDLGLKWKHNAYISYSNDDVSVTLTQIFRSGYKNQVLPGVLAGTFNPPNDVVDVDDYVLYNLSVAYTGIEGFKLTMGVRNLLDTDPPFAISYDSNNGSGGAWEPRVADPRGRSFTIAAEVKF